MSNDLIDELMSQTSFRKQDCTAAQPDPPPATYSLDQISTTLASIDDSLKRIADALDRAHPRK